MKKVTNKIRFKSYKNITLKLEKNKKIFSEKSFKTKRVEKIKLNTFDETLFYRSNLKKLLTKTKKNLGFSDDNFVNTYLEVIESSLKKINLYHLDKRLQKNRPLFESYNEDLKSTLFFKPKPLNKVQVYKKLLKILTKLFSFYV
jgi:hypothetical protein